MAEYHVGNGFENIYAGTLSKDKRRWVNKSDVTDEAIAAVFTCYGMGFYIGKLYAEQKICEQRKEMQIDEYKEVDPLDELFK